MAPKYRYDNVKLDLIDVGPWQSRTRRIEENTDELAENIRALGLINPISVYEKPDKRFVLVAGQRRLTAYEKLHDRYGPDWDAIPAKIYSSMPTEEEAKAISLSENLFRLKLVSKDMKDSMMMLYQRCKASVSTIVKTLGLPRDLVLDTISYEGLPEDLKKEVDAGLDLDLAVRAATLSESPEGDVDVEMAKRIIPELKALVPAQTKKLEQIRREKPLTPIEEAIEEAKSLEPTRRVVIELLMREYEGLGKYKSERKLRSEREAAYKALITYLIEEGYI